MPHQDYSLLHYQLHPYKPTFKHVFPQQYADLSPDAWHQMQKGQTMQRFGAARQRKTTLALRKDQCCNAKCTGNHQRGVHPLHAPHDDKAEVQIASVTWTLSTAWMLPAFYGNVITLPAWWQWLAMQASRRLVKLGTFQGTCCLQRLQLDSQTSVVSWPAQPALYHPVSQSVHCCCHRVCCWSEAAGKIA